MGNKYVAIVLSDTAYIEIEKLFLKNNSEVSLDMFKLSKEWMQGRQGLSETTAGVSWVKIKVL